ncbi:AfsR/SARP family transcriptional regulator [Streptomyces odonnellii]|uniref:AfsR/SARP family transcriptional regulator n=1 Tax=Streptomyces odonnellii TaxID=1417980 RepID=UPI000624FA8C|nr:BTAD domain-containing putative transcriptional regulator [Streptomyces odonnellii]
MRYLILGTTEARDEHGGGPALGGARVRALLCALALRPGRAVAVTELVDDVWDDEPPHDAPAALQALVGRLRRVLGREAIDSVPGGGYRLAAVRDDVDLYVFERLAREGAARLDAGDPGAAARTLREALALWRGPALVDLPGHGRDHAVRPEAQRLAAHKHRIEADLRRGATDTLVPELMELVAAHPYDEPFRAQFIRALWAEGRRADALAAYEDTRRAFADGLGADPGPELAALHKRMRAGDGLPAGGNLSAGTSPPPGTSPLTDTGTSIGTGTSTGADTRTRSDIRTDTGTRTDSGTLTGTGAEAGRAGAEPRGNLRPRLTSFVGREPELAAIRADLTHSRLVTLTGPGGSGKTRLAEESAPSGAWLVELAPLEAPSAVPGAVLNALGLRETQLSTHEGRPVQDDPTARLVEHLARRDTLLILDNCEHVIGAAAALAETLLTRCPGLRILATSREPLGVWGEVVRPVEPLPPDPAFRLFAERGRGVRPGFEAGEDAGAVGEICRRLDGLPLAIELAAARLRMLSPRQIADRLDDRFRLLTSGSRTVLPRQQTLRAVVDWSWDLLDERERAVLRRLSVFAGGCALPAAEFVCATDDEPGPDGVRHAAHSRVASRDVAGILGALIDKSLVVAAPSADGGMRYRLLETVGEYAAERLDEAGERGAVERRHLVHYRELARTTDPLLRGPRQRSGMAVLQREYENVRTALRRAHAAGDEQEMLCLVLSLGWFWLMLDLRAEARQWARAAALLGPDPFAAPVVPAPPIPARCTDAPPPMTPEMLQEARREVRLIEMVSMGHDSEDWTSPERRALLERVATAYRPGLPQTCRFPGTLNFVAIMLTGDTDRLRLVLDETVRTCEEFGYEWELAGALHVRANVLANRSAWAAEAGRDADRSLAIYDRLGDAWGAAEALSARGEARDKRGEYALAAEDYAAAIRHAESLGAQSQVVLLRSRLAATLFETGRGEEGERMLREVLAEDRETAHDAMPAARLFLALWLGRTGRVAEAREQLALLLEIIRSRTLLIFDGFVNGAFAHLDCMEGNWAPAVESSLKAVETSLMPLSQMIAPEMAAVHLLTVAWALGGLAGEDGREGGGTERAGAAARLIGAYEGLLPAGHFRNSVERELLAHACEVVDAVLDDTAATKARAEGVGLTVEEAVALVRTAMAERPA